jgi:hemerythrin-like domain-containing protein
MATAVRGSVAGAVAAVRRKVSARGTTDAIALLEADHRRMEDLMKRGEDTTERAVQGRKDLLDRLTAELNVHELIEEQVLYPALQKHPEAKDIVLEGFQEHHVADLIVKELHEVAADNEQWGAKFKVLKESIEHHIGEEEGEMFRTARAVFSQEELETMGAQMAALKTQAQGS